MEIIRNFILFLISISYLTILNVNAKNIEDFGWSFQKDFNDVYSSLNISQAQTCELNINTFKLETEIKPLWNNNVIKKPDIYNFEANDFYNVVKKQHSSFIFFGNSVFFRKFFS